LRLALLGAVALGAEQLPIKTYTTADGLARDLVDCIVQDGRGFLWFCTTRGVSRFDGYTFTNYGTNAGLPNRLATSLRITRDGVLWVGTWGGLFRLDPNSPAPQKFEYVRVGGGEYSEQIRTLLEDRSGVFWVGSMDGLYRLAKGTKTHFEPVDLGIQKAMNGTRPVRHLMEDRHGALWIGAARLCKRTSDGQLVTFFDDRLKSGFLTIYTDQKGTLWAGGDDGLYQLKPDARPNGPIVTRAYTMKNGLPSNRIEDLLETSDGRFWVGGAGGLAVYVASVDRFETFTTANGLSDSWVKSLAEDRDGNLWVGTEAGGVMRIARQGFTSYTQMDGLTDTRIASIFVDQVGELCTQTTSALLVRGWSLDCFDGKRFSANRPRYPTSIQYFGWGWSQTVLHDHTGEWWISTGQGLCRFGRAERAAKLAGNAAVAVYTTSNGLPGNDIFRLFEDSRGDIWVSTAEMPPNPLTRWERTTGRFHIYSEADGLPAMQIGAMTFAEDRHGHVWVGLADQGLARFQNGHFTVYSESDGVPAGLTGSLHLDRAGRLWIGTSRGGLLRIDNPAEVRPHFIAYTTAEGLSSETVNAIVEDQWGRIYASTDRGVDRLDPSTGLIKHYTTADGLPRGELMVAGRDRQGGLWFGSKLGLSRLVPVLDRPSSPPSALISEVRVRGVAQPVAQVAQNSVTGLVLQPNQNQVNVNFVALAFAPGESLRYQYRLVGLDTDWSPPTARRSVNYAGLRPGAYKFEVRALNTEGTVSPQPASVAFTILSPIWQRWWFRSAMGIVLGALIYAFHRHRLAQVLALERMRTRIAADLHDDIGASLSQIALLSEVARRKIERAGLETAGPLFEIASISRELVDAMGDIVWAINPKHDRLSNLEHRMRRFAIDVLNARNIDLDFRALSGPDDIRVGADLRRQVFLIFKEAVNNIARHSGCTQARVDFKAVEGDLVLEIADSSKGFDPTGCAEGNGLTNIRKRVSDLGGSVMFESAPNHGTAVRLRLPLPHQYWWGRSARS
jgi:ligand-binding sensor domain-containing protein/two-component sensor histidine kinase